jgi:hypothetical protein
MYLNFIVTTCTPYFPHYFPHGMTLYGLGRADLPMEPNKPNTIRQASDY